MGESGAGVEAVVPQELVSRVKRKVAMIKYFRMIGSIICSLCRLGLFDSPSMEGFF
jgi:hypothetical protein